MMQKRLTAILLASPVLTPSALTACDALPGDGFDITPRPAHAERKKGERTVTFRTSLRGMPPEGPPRSPTVSSSDDFSYTD
jgi:hypothetical protein